MKKTTLLIICLVTTLKIYSQESQSLNLKLLQPGIEYQVEMKNKLYLSFDLGFGLLELGYNREDKFEPYISTFSNITIKKIYNHSKVLNNNNRLLSDSGNYYGIRYLSYLKDYFNNSNSRSYNYAIGPVWGIKRCFKSFYYQVELGFGYHYVHNVDQISPLARVCIGLNLKRW